MACIVKQGQAPCPCARTGHHGAPCLAVSHVSCCRRPYFNIFALVEELGLDPFTPWTRSQQWSPGGLEVDAAILQARPCL